MCSDRAKTDTGRLIGVVLVIDIITKLNTIARILQCGVPKGDGPKGALRLVGFVGRGRCAGGDNDTATQVVDERAEREEDAATQSRLQNHEG